MLESVMEGDIRFALKSLRYLVMWCVGVGLSQETLQRHVGRLWSSSANFNAGINFAMFVFREKNETQR